MIDLRTGVAKTTVSLSDGWIENRFKRMHDGFAREFGFPIIDELNQMHRNRPLDRIDKTTLGHLELNKSANKKDEADCNRHQG